MDDLCAAGARKPDVAAVPPAVQVSAALVLSDKGHQGVEHVRHGPGRLPQPRRRGQYLPSRSPVLAPIRLQGARPDFTFSHLSVRPPT